MTMSEGSNDRTSVGLSLRRNCRFSARIRASDTSAIATSRGADGGATFSSHRARPAAEPPPPRPSPSGTVSRRRGCARFGAPGPLLSGWSTVGFVRLHDLLDERVAHDVLLVEVHEGDAVDVAHHLHRLDQSGRASGGQI